MALLLAPAEAAPTCQNQAGDTMRCGTKRHAMPVGWVPSPQLLWRRQISQPPGPARRDLAGRRFLGIGLLFALIALLPEFDGSPAGGGWDRQENDQEDNDEDAPRR